MIILKKSYHQSSVLTTRTIPFLRITLLMFLINMHLKREKNFRANYKPDLSKTLRLAIMKHSRLNNKANKSQLPSDKQNYKEQQNLVTN